MDNRITVFDDANHVSEISNTFTEGAWTAYVIGAVFFYSDI